MCDCIRNTCMYVFSYKIAVMIGKTKTKKQINNNDKNKNITKMIYICMSKWRRINHLKINIYFFRKYQLIIINMLNEVVKNVLTMQQQATHTSIVGSLKM